MSELVTIAQAAAIPICGFRICLINSRNGGCIIPKGRIEPGETVEEAAFREAWEEAGLHGDLEEQPIGAYLYQKNEATYHVSVVVMHVTHVAEAWPEDHRRRRLWVMPFDALSLVHEPGLRKILALLTEPARKVLQEPLQLGEESIGSVVGSRSQ